MSAWTVASAGMFLALLPCAAVCLTSDCTRRLVGLEMAAVVETLLLLLLSEATHRVVFVDLALALALLAFGGGLVFARFLERWL